MTRLRNRFAYGVLISSVIACNSAFAAPKAKVSLVPFSSAVTAGQPFEVGVRFELDAGWHIYWQNSGDAGSPPSVAWKLPEGFTVGELQFPAPKSHVSPGDIITNILKGEPVLLATVYPPKELAGSDISIAAKVVSFVCESQCLQETANVDLKLPVVASTAEVKSANDELHALAKKKLPKSSSKALTVKPIIVNSQITPGSKLAIGIQASIAKNHHIQSNKPTNPSLIPAEVFLERVSGIRHERPQFPEAKIRKDQYLGELSEFTGEVLIQIPVEVDAARAPGPLKIGGVLSFQACEDGGNCLPPESVGFSVPLEVVAGAPTVSGQIRYAETPTSAPAASAEPKESAAASLEKSVDPINVPEAGGVDGFLKRWGLGGLLLGCFLYGLFINATPCVLPLLSIKVLGFVQQAHESRKRTMILGLAFGAGVIVFFVALGLLAARGRNIQQLPVAVIVLGGVVLAMALSMLGVFTLHVPTSATSLEARIHQEGPIASFAKGAFAPVLGLACTGPLLAGAFAWASQQQRETAILAFSFMGLGMASPYMLFGANPRWLSFLPRPGMWMVTLERIMGFLLLAMVVKLIDPLIVQIGVEGLQWTLVFYVALAMACWMLGKIQITMPALERWKLRTAAATIVLGSSAVVFGWVYPLGKAEENAKIPLCEPINDGTHIAWRTWTPQAVQETVNAGKIAFVDFTASYCTICQSNKKSAINTPEVIAKISQLGAVAFKADFTNGDENIADALQRIKGSILVPLNLIYPAGRPDRPIILQTNLTTSYLLQKFDEAHSFSSQSASVSGM